MTWPLVRIQELGQVVTGRTPPGGEPEHFVGSIPFLTPTDIDGEHRHVSTGRFVSVAWDRQAARISLPPRAVCVVCIGATIGKICMTEVRSQSNQQINSITVDESRFDAAFVYYSMRLKREELKARAAGAATPILNKSAFSELSFAVPPLSLQRRIASILGAYDDLIEVNRRRIAVLEEMARRLFEEWFVHFRFPGHEGVQFARTQGDRLPNGWELVPFQALLESWRGGDWGEDTLTTSETEPVFVVRGTDIDELAQGTGNRVPARFIDRKSLEKRGLRRFDLIVENSINAKSRCAGKTLLVTPGVLKRLGGDSIAASFCKVFRFHDPQLAPIAHLHMKRLIETGDMALFQNVAANGIANFQAQRFVAAQSLALPTDLALRQKLVGAFQALTASTFADAISNLRATRDHLLPRLVSGDLPVTTAERELEAVA